MKKIGIMGGTFNPIHEGHVMIANAAYEQYHLDEVWFMPNHIPGYKDKSQLVSGEMRLEMVRLAIQNYPYFKASDYELKRTGNTYTAETMQLLSKDYQEVEFYFIIGMDSLLYFDKWKNPEIIISYAKILVAPRDHSSIDEMNKQIDYLHSIFGNQHFFPIECEEINCSSSLIRSEIAELYSHNNQEVHGVNWMNQNVIEYIINHHLYVLEH